MPIINNDYSLYRTNVQPSNSMQSTNEKKLHQLSIEKEKYESQAHAWNAIKDSLNDLRSATISLESVTATSGTLKSSLEGFVSAYNAFRETRDSHASGALRGSGMLSAIDNQLQSVANKLTNLNIGITMSRGKLVINDAKLDRAVDDPTKAAEIVSFLKVDGANPSFKSDMYRALDNALRPRLPGTTEGMIAGAMFTVENRLKHIERNIQIAGNMLAAGQSIASRNQAYRAIQNNRRDINEAILASWI